MFIDYLDTPIGIVEIQASHQGVKKVLPVAEALISSVALNITDTNEVTYNCKQQLQEYFSGTRHQFELPLDQQGSNFQQAVWDYLISIPFGEVVAYQTIAQAIDNPKAVRAVGMANARNPISIIVPCHRVIGSNGKLTGYAGGIERKAWLLAHEGCYIKQ